jgi:hypothetical protein
MKKGINNIGKTCTDKANKAEPCPNGGMTKKIYFCKIIK